MKNAALCIAIVLVILTAARAHGAEGMKTAIDIVEDFSGEANRLMASHRLPPASPAARENAIEELKQIRLTEPPGRKRSLRVYALVDAFTAHVVDSVRLSGGRGEDISSVTARLDKLRAGSLKKLGSVLDAESIEKTGPRAVPSLDLSPYDEPPSHDNDKGGILFR